MAARKSSRKISRRRIARRARKRRTQSRPALDLDALFGNLSDAIAVCASASGALAAAQERDGRGRVSDCGDHIATLEFGVKETRKAFADLATAVETRCGAAN